MSSDETINVRYMVDDVEESIAFYTKLFGFEVLTSAAPAFADVKRGNLRLLLSGPKSSAGRPMPDGAKPGPGGWNRIHFIVDDLDTEVRRLRDAGASFRNDVVEGPGGKQILLQDPSGNVVELFQPANSLNGETRFDPASGRRHGAVGSCGAMGVDGLLDRTRALVPALKEQAAAAEQVRHVLPETYDALAEAGVFKMCGPERFGGYEADFRDPMRRARHRRRRVPIELVGGDDLQRHGVARRHPARRGARRDPR